jgi:hypothetical protein
VAKPFEALGNWLFGEDGQQIPSLPQGLPAELAQALDRHVRMLVEFQNTEYAELYLDRLGRFHERHGVDTGLFHEIADLLAVRMSFNDPIRVSQIVLERAPLADPANRTIDPPNNVYRPEVQEFVGMFPREYAETIADTLAWMKMLRGRMRIRLDGNRGRARLRFFLKFRRIRPQSLRHGRESSSIERWLHMVDRALTKQPGATAEVVRSVRIIRGFGANHRLSLENWNLIINSLAKPAFDGALVLPNLAAALAAACSAALNDASGEELRRTIADIRSTAASAVVQGAAGSRA